MPELIRDQYEVVSEIGAGGMGKVLLARDLKLNRMVALKTLLAVHRENAERRQRFFLEAQAASALNHPNIITIYDILSEPEREIMVMEYVAGKTLVDIIPNGGLRPQRLVDIAVQVADALEAAHGAGIVHRDLKPGNIMVTDKGLVKILDFGLAKREEPTPDDPDATALAPLTTEGTIMGTVAYMSPEQAQGKKVDARSDIFSFGAVLYEMATGLRAFTGDNNVTTLTSVLRDEPKPAGQISPDLPPVLVGIIYQCLRKDVSARAQSMAEVKAELKRLKVMLDSGTLMSGASIPASMQSGVYRPASGNPAAPESSAGPSTPPPPSGSGTGTPPPPSSGAQSAAPPPPSPKDAIAVAIAGWRRMPSRKRLWIGAAIIFGLAALFRDRDHVKTKVVTSNPGNTEVKQVIDDVKKGIEEGFKESGDEPMENRDVVAMVKGKMSDELIIEQMRRSKTAFDLSPKEVVKLVKAGVSEKLIVAMRDPSKIPPPPPARDRAAEPTPPLPPPPPGAPPKKGEKLPNPEEIPLAPLRDGLPIELEVVNDIPQDAMPGTVIEFRVASDLMIDGKLAVPKGAPATGVIIAPPRRKLPGRGGRGMFLFGELLLPRGVKVRLRPSSNRATPPMRSFDTGTPSRDKDLLVGKGTIYVAYITQEGDSAK